MGFQQLGQDQLLELVERLLVAEKDDSLVVIASVMSRSRASSLRVRTVVASSSRPFMFHLRATGISRDSSR